MKKLYLVVGNNTCDSYQLSIDLYDGYSQYQEYTGSHGCIEGEFSCIKDAVRFCKKLVKTDKHIFVVTGKYNKYFNKRKAIENSDIIELYC